MGFFTHKNNNGDVCMDLFEQFKTWMFVASLAMFGGLVDAVRRYKHGGEEMAFTAWFVRTVGDLLIASFAGLITFWSLVDATGTHEFTGFMCAAVSIAGYLGGKAIDIFAAIWEAVARKSIKEQ